MGGGKESDKDNAAVPRLPDGVCTKGVVNVYVTIFHDSSHDSLLQKVIDSSHLCIYRVYILALHNLR